MEWGIKIAITTDDNVQLVIINLYAELPLLIGLRCVVLRILSVKHLPNIHSQTVLVDVGGRNTAL